jgi:hypothetical protein
MRMNHSGFPSHNVEDDGTRLVSVCKASMYRGRDFSPFRKEKQMRRHVVIGFALALAASAHVQHAAAVSKSAAQSPKQAVAEPVTVEGCVVKEVDVPNRKPPENLRAQAEADDDYVLMSTKMISGAAPSAPDRSTREAATGTSGTGTSDVMYDIEGIAKDQLKAHVGKRVQIEGTFDHLENAKLPVSFATDLVEIKGTTMRSVPGACPSK